MKGMTGGFKEHQVILFLDRDLYRAFIRLQADRNLGRSYAGLLPYVEGLYHLGYLSSETYEAHFKRYSEPLDKEPLTREKELEEQTQQQVFKQKNSVFAGMIEQFQEHFHNDRWLEKCKIEAEKFADKLPSARRLLTRMADVRKDEAPAQ